MTDATQAENAVVEPRLIVETGLDRRVADIIEPTIEQIGYQLVRVRLSAQNGASLQIMCERPDGTMTVEDCETVSMAVSPVLDVEDPIDKAYHLEVSSPGIDRPIFGAAQFARVVGENAKVVLKLPQDGRRRLQGKIARVEGSTVVFILDAGEVAVDAANIDKARLVPDWIALGMAPAVDDSGRDARPGKQKKKPVGKKPAAKTPTSDTTINSRAARKPSDAE